MAIADTLLEIQSAAPWLKSTWIGLLLLGVVGLVFAVSLGVTLWSRWDQLRDSIGVNSDGSETGPLLLLVVACLVFYCTLMWYLQPVPALLICLMCGFFVKVGGSKHPR